MNADAKALTLFTVRETPILVFDAAGSHSALTVARETQAGQYLRHNPEIRDGDVVVDIGAHIGLFSIYLAKRYPGCRILAFEPFPENYENCRANVELNGVSNVELMQTAITCDGRRLEMSSNPRNSGGASALKPTLAVHGVEKEIPSCTLEEIFARHGIERCKLLKIDCEGMEYEILGNTSVLNRVEYLSGEFHVSRHLAALGYEPGALLEHVRYSIPENRLAIDICRVSD